MCGLCDANGLAVSTRRAGSLAAYERALEQLHGARGDALATIDEALGADPAFAMGHALRAALLVMAADETLEPALASSVAAGEALGLDANARERRHFAAARAWLERDLPRSIRLYGEIVIDHPRDSLALRVAHFGDFQLGHAALLHDRIARVLPAWHPALPHYGALLGMHAFGLEESQHYDHAEQTARRALDIDPGNPGAIHALAHVLEMQGRSREGIEWLESSAPRWLDCSGYALHHWWHLALFHLDLDDPRAALALYDMRLRAGRPMHAGALVDASSLLWRLDLHGVDVGARWREIADGWSARRIGGLRPFNDVHAMLAFAATRRDSSAKRLLVQLRDCAARTEHLQSAIHRSALPFCEALIAFGRGDHDAAVERLASVSHLAERCGGSRAQCDLMHLTWIESALRARRYRLARTLIAERHARKPASLINRRLDVRFRAGVADDRRRLQPFRSKETFACNPS